MRIPLVLTLAGALAGVILIVVVAQALIAPDLPLITEAVFSHEVISPNADGMEDIAVFSYTVSKTVTVSFTFEGSTGAVFAFRERALRAPNDYQVAFSGVVDGFSLPDDSFPDQVILRRVIPDDIYTWRLVAIDAASGAQDERTGTLVIEGGDVPLPNISEFTVSPTDFTPNQDGINDRTQINLFLEQDADLSVYLLPPNGGQPLYLAERDEETLPHERGRHLYDYDGGVDLNADPPPDGEYTLMAEAQDAVGQQVRRSAVVTIRNGGKPFAEIVSQTAGVSVIFETRPWEERFFASRDLPGDLIVRPTDPDILSRTTITMPVGDLLVFMLTVENYSDVPIRTTGPQPGTVYEWDQRDSTLGATEEPGAWRVGIDCTTATIDYPWRWSLGSDDTLDVVTDPDTGIVYRYLPPGERAVVWGAIRMTRVEVRNPQTCWAGLIHEEVEVSLRNSRVGPREIRLVDANS